MRLNILIGGKAGQGINKVSSIVSNVLVNYGYFTFNYRDYQSLIRGVIILMYYQFLKNKSQVMKLKWIFLLPKRGTLKKKKQKAGLSFQYIDRPTVQLAPYFLLFFI